MQDMGVDDFEQALEDGIDDSSDVIEELLPYTAQTFRAASPDNIPSLTGLVTGLSPSKVGVRDSEEKAKVDFDDTVNIFSALSELGATTGHFGVWPFKQGIKKTVDSGLDTEHFEQAQEAAQAFLSGLSSDEDFYVNIWLPRIDATFDFGANFTEENWNAKQVGVDLVQHSPETNCRDSFRGENDDYVARYQTCPRQIYRANRVHELARVATLLQYIENLPGDIFTVLTSANGPESSKVDGHSHSFPKFRGLKRSLYDGGLRVPFRFNIHGPNAPSGPANVIETPLSLLDLLPTTVHMHSDKSSSQMDVFQESNDLDGISLQECLQTGVCNKTRLKPLMFEWAGYSSPEHCMFNSPRFAIVENTYKVLWEPGNFRNIEMYDLTQGQFELVNIADTELADQDQQQELTAIKLSLLSQLQQWSKTLPKTTSKVVKHHGCAKNLAALQNPKPLLRKRKRLKKVGSNDLKGIIFILADDMGVGDLSEYSRRSVAKGTSFNPDTEAFDSIMKESVTLSNFYASACVCSPTRAAIMTARHPAHKNVRIHNFIDKSSSTNAYKGVADYLGQGVNYEKHLTTMPKFFHDNGFVTAHFGKWHLGYDYTKEPDMAVNGGFYGLDEYMIYGYLDGDETFEKVVQFETASEPHPNSLDNKDLYFASYAQQALVNRTISFLKDRVQREEKFFVNLWLQNPHAPFNLAQDGDQAAENGFPSSANPLPTKSQGASLKSNVDDLLPVQIYQTLLRDQEREVARLYSTVEDLDLDEHTLIVYTADNGAEDPQLNYNAQGSNEPFRGAKRSLYEGGIRVPFFAQWKGHLLAAGKVVTTPATTTDLFPTFASLAGLTEEFAQLPDFSDIQGEDFSCALQDATCSHLEERPLFFEFRDEFIGDCLGMSPRFAVRQGRYKLLWEAEEYTKNFPKDKHGSSRLELYDLQSDPGETTNLLFTHSGDDFIVDTAAAMRLMIINDFVHSSWYDSNTTPKSKFTKSKPRLDRTRWAFSFGDRCDAPETASPVFELSLTGSRSLEEFEFYIHNSTSPTISAWSASPTTHDEAVTEYYSSSAYEDIEYTLSPTASPSFSPTLSPTPAPTIPLDTVSPTSSPSSAQTSRGPTTVSPTSLPTSSSTPTSNPVHESLTAAPSPRPTEAPITEQQRIAIESHSPGLHQSRTRIWLVALLLLIAKHM